MTLGEFGSTLNDELNRLANGGTYRDKDDMVDEALAAKQWANRENINPYSTDTVGVLNEIAGLGTNRQNWLDFNGVCNYIAGTTGLPAAAALRQVYNTTDLLTSQSAYYVDATAPTNWGSLGYVYLPGRTGNYLSVPDANNLDITGDIDIRVRVALDDWTPSAINGLLYKWQTASTRSYGVYIGTSGVIGFNWTTDGSTIKDAFSSAPTGITDGSVKWIRVTLDVDNGAGGHTVTFYTSDNGTSWSQLGTAVYAGTTSIFSSTSQIEIGSLVAGTGYNLQGNVYQAQVLNGIGGTTVLDVNIATDYASSKLNTFTATTGQTVTVNGVDTIANLGNAGSLLPTTLGSSTAADSNDPKFLDHTGTNYVYVPGTQLSNMSVPDAAALDITGDIDLRAQVALDDWTPAAINVLVSKWADLNRSYSLGVNTNGTLLFNLTTDGTTDISRSSTVAPTVADGATLWVRATLDVDNGASGHDVIFYTSTNGTTWTQLGSTVTNAGTVTMFSGTAPVILGSRSAGFGQTMSGKHFRAQIFNGIDGTKVLDVDTSVITAGSATSFTAVTGQTVTINRSTSGRKSVAVTQPTWLFGTDDYMEVNNRYMASGTYLYLPGVASNFASTPDSAALDITSDIDIRVRVALDDWTTPTQNTFVSKESPGDRAYAFYSTGGSLYFSWSADGNTLIANQSTVTYTPAAGTVSWVRATLDVDNGAGGNTGTFYTSSDGITWTQLGATSVRAGTTSIYSGTNQVAIGARANGTSPAKGKFYRAQILNGIGGPAVLDANFETSITSLLQTSFTESSANAATVTINRSGSAYRSAGITAAGYLYPGATNTFAASATDFLKFGLNDSFTVVAAFRQWATTADRRVISNVGLGPGYTISQQTSNRAYFQVTDFTVFPTATVNVTAGDLVTISGVRNVTTDTISSYLNTAAPVSTTDTNTKSTSNLLDTFRIGAQYNGIYADMELLAAAVFRSALTASQIRQITNYFANREVYL